MEKIEWDYPPKMIGWNRLKALRKMRGLSQLEVAAGAGVSIATLYFLEAGFESRVAAKTRKKLCKYFNIEESSLFPLEWIGDQPRDAFIAKAKQKAARAK